MEIKSLLNKISKDELGRVQAVLAINKPAGMTSHDVVNIIRKKLGTRKVGHAGALDPFATGLLFILVGRYTKLSDKLILAKKEYIGRFIFGLATETQDTEGKIMELKSVKISKKDIEDALKSFQNGYEQYVSIFSSVKVGGKKLREVARKAKSFSTKEEEGKKIAVFEMNDKTVEIEVPRKHIDIHNIELIEVKNITSDDLDFRVDEKKDLVYADIKMEVSKGTYIRQFAEDLGEKLGVPAMLASLTRTKIEDISLDDAKNVDEISL